ncbi:putative g-protein coupled receptor fragment [Schistosoma mansoni]|uniref:putative g-protein coupled receptor fragment n=1 Tax=Schistosoma mansoni TaxID=6183 RepID=UPI0001A630C3|nr:putative g-protein coupled receptor fragment [Schistosoma mansoni]
MNYTFASIFPPFTTSIIALLATTVSTATLGGNIVVLIAFFIERSLRIPSNYFIASLAMTDVLIGLFSMNLFITYQLLGYWPLGHLICDLWLSLDFSACLTSQYTVFLITLDRFCLVKIPAKYRNWRTYNKLDFDCFIKKNLLTVTGDNQRNLKGNYPINKCHFEYGSETSGCSTFYPTNNNSTESKTQLSSIIEKSQLLPNTDLSKKYEDSNIKIPKDESLSSISDENFSLPSVNFYVPSPKVPISSPIQNDQSTSSKYIESDNSSPVWIKKDACYDSGLNLYVYDICPQLMKCHTLIHEGNICQNAICLSDSTSWNQCIQSCCLLEKCEYSDYTTSTDNPSSTYYNQSTMNDYWCLRFMDKWNKSKQNQTMKSSCIYDPSMKHNSVLWYKSHDKSYLTEVPSNSNINPNREICPLCQMDKDNNNDNIVRQSKSKQDPGLHRIIEQIKLRQNRKHACKALKTISLILGAFIFCWTPYHIIVLIKGFCDDINTYTSCVNIHLYNLSYWLCYMNSPINPFCYALSNISFRRTFFRILKCDFQKR